MSDKMDKLKDNAITKEDQENISGGNRLVPPPITPVDPVPPPIVPGPVPPPINPGGPTPKDKPIPGPIPPPITPVDPVPPPINPNK